MAIMLKQKVLLYMLLLPKSNNTINAEIIKFKNLFGFLIVTLIFNKNTIKQNISTISPVIKCVFNNPKKA